MTSSTARIATTAVLGAVTLMASAAVLAGPASADAVAIVAQDCDGVTVVVDFTDLRGAVETGCAEGDPESGRDALELAGFTPVDGATPGLLCTIDAQPDPCPTEFEGSYWAYWQVVDGEWVSSSVGLDEADPTPGGTEGWRYNDGSVPPPLPGAADQGGGSTTDDAVTEAPTDDAAGTDTAEDDPSTATSADPDAAGEEGSNGGVSPALWVVIGVVVLALVIGLVVRVTGARAEKEAPGSDER